MFEIFTKYQSFNNSHPLLLNSFDIVKNVEDDLWNHKPKTHYWCEVLDDKEIIAKFDYRTTVGQIGSISIPDNYKKRALEEQILIYMMKDMQDAGAETIWEVCPEKCFDFPNIIYHNLWDFEYKPGKEVHSSVSGGGYAMNIPNDLRELKIKSYMFS